MFAGHIGAALAIGGAERRVNIGVFVGAALLLDLACWILVLLSVESVRIPANFATTHQPDFTFPYSHGLRASLVWSVVAGLVTCTASGRLPQARVRAALLVGAAVFSHWLLDALVHAPELPLAGAGSTRVGLGLWHRMPVALVVEAGIVLAGAWLFLRSTDLSRARAVSLATLSGLALGFTVVGMTIAPPPPSVHTMAASSLVTVVLVCALAFWLGRPSHGARA